MGKAKAKTFFHPRSHEARNYRHGHKPAGRASPEYITWNGMRARCTNPKNPNYDRYGARGVKVCDEWLTSFVTFLGDMGRKPTPQHSIERINNNGNYEPGNCRWATNKEQANNRRSSRLLTYNGLTQTVAFWAQLCGLRIGTLHSRLKSGWSVERALTTPIRVTAAKPHNEAPQRKAA